MTLLYIYTTKIEHIIKMQDTSTKIIDKYM